MAALYGDYAKQTGQTARRTSLRVGLRQNQVVARSVNGMAVRAEHAGQQLRQCAHTMNRVTELHATGFDCIDSVGHLPYFRLLRGFHLAHGIINHIIGSILLRILQTGNADSAILYLNLVQIDTSRSLHQPRQGLLPKLRPCPGPRKYHHPPTADAWQPTISMKMFADKPCRYARRAPPHAFPSSTGWHRQ